MPRRKLAYTILPFEDFGRAVIDGEDLDPLSTLLYRNVSDKGLAGRIALAWLLTTHAGTAVAVAEEEGNAFWAAILRADAFGFPVGTERRNLTGPKLKRTVDTLSGWFPEPEDLFPKLHRTELSQLLKGWGRCPALRCYTGWRAAALADRALGLKITNFNASPTAYREPMQGLQALAEQRGTSRLEALGYAEWYFGEKYPAPPRNERPFSKLEVHDLLYLWNQHRHHHYAPGDGRQRLKTELSLFPGQASRLLGLV